MNGHQQNRIGKPTVEKPVYKFLIAFVGGFSAAVFPRLMAALTQQDSSNILLLSQGYLLVAVLFACMIGSVVMIMEWGVSKEPGATLMTALGIPALLAGALNTSNGAYVLDAKSKENIELANTIQNLSNIPEASESEGFTILGDAGNTIKPSNSISISFIRTAHAAGDDGKQNKFDFDPGIKSKEQKYYIILDRRATESAVKQRLKSIKLKVPTALAVKAGSKFLVIIPEAKTKSKAVLEAIKLKEKGFRPELLKKK